MHDVDALVANEPREPYGVQRHGERIFGRGREGKPNSALGLKLAQHSSAAGGDKAARTGFRQRGGNVHRRALRAAGVKVGQDLQNRSSGKQPAGDEKAREFLLHKDHGRPPTRQPALTSLKGARSPGVRSPGVHDITHEKGTLRPGCARSADASHVLIRLLTNYEQC
jgi:hypothetical protein